MSGTRRILASSLEQNLEEGLNDIAQTINIETPKIQATTPFTDCTETEPIVDALNTVRSNPI